MVLSPGPHWAWPSPIDEVVRIPVGQAQTITSTIGWYANTANEAAGPPPQPLDRLNPDRDGYLVTGDENIIHVRATLLYRINESALISSNGVTGYPFAFASASNLVQHAFDNALTLAAAGSKIDDIMTRDVAGFRDRVRARFDQLIAQYRLAIIVDNITVRSSPPIKLAQTFTAVTEAGQRRGTLISQAQNEENQIISRARADAQERINAGERDRDALVKSVQAEADRFKTLLAEYKRNPDLFMQQRQNEVLQRVLTNAHYVLVLPPAVDGKPRQIWIPVGPEAKPPKPPEKPPASGDDHHEPPP